MPKLQEPYLRDRILFRNLSVREWPHLRRNFRRERDTGHGAPLLPLRRRAAFGRGLTPPAAKVKLTERRVVKWVGGEVIAVGERTDLFEPALGSLKLRNGDGTIERDNRRRTTDLHSGPLRGLTMNKMLATRQIVNSILTGILVWCTAGIGVSVLVSAVVVFTYALFIVKDAFAGVLSGAGLGLLDFVPVYVKTTPCFGWWHIGWFVIAAVAGGSAAGFLNSQVHPSRVPPGTRPAWKIRAALGTLLFFCAAGFESEHYGERLLERLPAWPVSERAIAKIHTGNALGTARSGSYQYLGRFHRSCVVGSNGGVMEIKQQDGSLQAYVADMWLKGGINADGRFWAAGQRSSTTDRNSILRNLFVGRFRNETQFDYILRSSLIVNGSTKNTTMESGTGSLLRP